MSKETENYKQQLFETAAEYGKAGRAAYHELEQHIDESLENRIKPKIILADLGEPEQAIRRILKADGKASYPVGKIAASGVLLAIGLGLLIGLSGLLMPLGSRIGGMDAISGDPDVLPYTSGRCAQYRQLVPSAHNCREAARLHHYYELTDGRLVLIAFGLLCLVAFWYAFRKKWLYILPRKTLLLLATSIYTAIGSLIMLVALGDLSAGRTWDWLGDFLTGVPLFLAGIITLAYYLGYMTLYGKKIKVASQK